MTEPNPKAGVIAMVVEGGRIKAHDAQCRDVAAAREEGRMIITLPGRKIPRDMPRCSCLKLAS